MTRSAVRCAVFLAVLVPAAGKVWGQVPQRSASHPPLGAPAVESGPDYHHASTVMQGHLDGWARWLRGLGLARYNNALALRHEQAARRHAQQNAVSQVDAYFERLRRNQQHRRALQPPRRSDRVVTARRQPPALPTPDELDRESGAIAWPYPLRGEAFALHRGRLQQLFAERRYCETGLGSQNQLAVKTEIQEMRRTLAHCVRQREIDYDGYTVAREFLERLNNEARS